ncbi:STN domain-containing protein [Cytophagaceae bacterium ABcell3]|nr:STN domain-containing protein [Cytophagaceae bacterium ABcell3]
MAIWLSTMHLSHSQTHDQDSLYAISGNILDKKVCLNYSGDKLITALQKLSIEHGIKLSYSDSKLGPIKIKAVNKDNIPLSAMLELLLRGTKFNYVLAGRSIFIVEDKNKKPAPVNESESDTVKTKESVQRQKHIYTPNNNYIALTPKQKREVHRRYKKELKWASKRAKRLDAQKSDTLKPSQPKRSTKTPHANRLFVAGNLGVGIPHTRIKEVGPDEILQETKPDGSTSALFIPEVSVGILTKNWRFRAGISYKTFSTDKTWQETKTKGPPPGNPAQAERRTETVRHLNAAKFQVFSIPLEAMYVTFWDKTMVGVGGGLGINILTRSSFSTNELRQYYRSETDEDFIEQTNSLAIAAHLRAEAGYFLSEHILITSGVSYNRVLSPYYHNALYHLHLDYFSLSLGLKYLFPVR